MTLREQILEVIGEVGVTAHPDDIVVTTGSQMALDLVTRVFCDPGDVVLVEAPSYVGALGVFRAYECDVVHVAMDDEGLVPSALSEAIAAARAAGKRVKLIYTIPSFHNPAGVTQGPARRAEILAIAQSRGHRACSRTIPTACSASRASRRARSAPTTPTASSTSARSPRRSPPGCGSAGPWRRTACARSWCWPTRPRCCARRTTPSSPSPSTWRRSRGASRSRRSRRSTASAATRCWSRCRH